MPTLCSVGWPTSSPWLPLLLSNKGPGHLVLLDHTFQEPEPQGMGSQQLALLPFLTTSFEALR